MLKNSDLRMNENDISQNTTLSQQEPNTEPLPRSFNNHTTHPYLQEDRQTTNTDNLPVNDSSIALRNNPVSLDNSHDIPSQDMPLELKRLEDILLEIKNLRIQNQYIIEHIKRIESRLR